jgi:hypothetical protein
MTYQGDPNRSRRRPGDYIRRDDGSWSMMPILLGVVVLLGVGILLIGTDWNKSATPVSGDGTTRQATPPAKPAPPPATQKQP